MKIAFILPSMANKGPVIVAKDIIEVLVSRGHIVDLYFFDDKDELIIGASAKVKIAIKESINFQEYDIIHSHGFRPDYYVWKYRRKIKGKCFSTMHNYIYDDLKYKYNKLSAIFFQWLWIRFLSRHDVIVVLSQDMKKYYSKWIKPSHIQVVYNGRSFSKANVMISPNKAVELDKLSKKYIVLGVIAQLVKRKGIDQIIRVLPDLKDFCLIIVGDGVERENLESLAVRMRVADRCYFVGYSNNGRQYLAWINIYMMVSRSEGFPLSLIEAASSGVPLVCSNIPIFTEMFNENDVVFFKLEDKESLKKAILTMHKKQTHFAEKVKVFYEERLTAEHMGSNYLHLYMSIF